MIPKLGLHPAHEDRYVLVTCDPIHLISKPLQHRFTQRLWDPDHHGWLIPMPYLNDLLIMFPNAEISESLDGYLKDQFERIEELARIAKLSQEELKQSVESGRKINHSSKIHLYPHQELSVYLLCKYHEFAIFDEQGLGKTGGTIVAAEYLISHGAIERALVVCPSTLIGNWVSEIKNFSELPIVEIGSRTAAARKKRWLVDENGIYVVNYEALLRDSLHCSAFLRRKKTWLILDESQKVKNPYAKTTNAIIRLARLASRRCLMSGTAVANRLHDIWSQFRILDGGKLFGLDFEKDFLSKYAYIADPFGHMQIVGYKNSDEIKDRIRRISIRRLKTEVLDLPPKVFSKIPVELSEKQRAIYGSIEDASDDEIIQCIELGIPLPDNTLRTHIRKIQAASNPKLLPATVFSDTPSKMEALDEIVESTLSAPDSKIVIWSCFIDTIKEIASRYKEYGVVTVFGEIPITDRPEVISKFQNDDSVRVFVGNPACAGAGITLTRASTAVYYDRDFNLSNFLQSQDRIHRIGQVGTCTIFILVAVGTIDEVIDKALTAKHTIASKVQERQ